jgi:hypothetical protein
VTFEDCLLVTGQIRRLGGGGGGASARGFLAAVAHVSGILHIVVYIRSIIER